MQDFPQLIADLLNLTHAAGLQNLTLQAEYCQRYGWFCSAHAFRGTASVLLVHSLPTADSSELREAITNALLEQLSAYYATAPQL